MSQTRVTFPCGKLSLEGVWHQPEGTAPLPAVIVCHPHPLYGGSMANNVVVAVCRALNEAGIAALRFNFRGVGKSGGEFGGGIAEQEDVRAALAFVCSRKEVDPKRMGLAGYSFGAGVAAPVACRDEGVARLALVSPVLSEAGWEELQKCPKPRFLIVGEGDFFVPLADFQERTSKLTEPKECLVVKGEDHFWWGHLEEMAGRVSQFFARGFETLVT